MKTKVIPIDVDDPMNGVVKYLRTNGKFSFLSANQSSYILSYKPASYLLLQETTSLFHIRNNSVGEYFEIHFLKKSFVSLTGYGFMGQNNTCAVPRNWNVSCMSTNPPTLLANETENNNLCPEGGSSSCVGCTSYKKQAYEVSTKNVNCTDIRFATTGINAKDTFMRNAIYYNFFGLSGIELFGTFGIFLGTEKYACIRRIFFRIHCFIIFCFCRFSVRRESI